MPDALAGRVAGQLVQFQRDGQPLFAGHAPVTLDLLLQCAVGIRVARLKFMLRDVVWQVENSKGEDCVEPPKTITLIEI